MRNDKMVARRASRIAKAGYRDGLAGIYANMKLIPSKYRKTYNLLHTKGMVDSGQFDNIHSSQEKTA